MRNKIAIIILFLSILLIGLEKFLPSLEGIGITVFRLAGYYLLFTNGTFIKTRLYRFIRLAVALLIIAVMFKIMHWPFADGMIIGAFSSIAILYSIHFLEKQNKNIIDYVKLFFVLAELSVRLLKIMHWYSPDEQKLFMYDLSFVIFVFYYIYKNHWFETKSN